MIHLLRGLDSSRYTYPGHHCEQCRKYWKSLRAFNTEISPSMKNLIMYFSIFYSPVSTLQCTKFVSSISHIYNFHFSIYIRAISSSSLHAIIAQSPALFPNIFKFCTVLPKFSNILPFFNIFCPFSEKLHACPYFVE